jgi:endoglucanase
VNQVSGANDPSSDIRLNQVGYIQGQAKRAIVKTGSTDFVIKTAKDKRIVFKGKLENSRYWPFSGEKVRVADFTKFDEPGTYRLWIGNVFSYEFEISDKVFDNLMRDALKMFYYARASTDLPEKYAGKWHRKAGHPDTDVKIHALAASPSRPAGTTISCSKGWYDAGDYNKYVVNSGISTFTLMALYEAFPDHMKKVSYGIPESDNSLPDILDEVRWNLDWLLTMQDPGDGGVYHKLTSPKFGGHNMPADSKQERFVVQKSTSAALNFAAVMAQASRVYAEFDKAFSKKCLEKALLAWKWAKANPYVRYRQPADIETGSYDDYSVVDEFAWAATELYITTKEDSYFKESNLLSLQFQVQIWDQVSPLGYISLIHNKDRLTSIVDIDLIEQRFVSFADFVYWFYTRSAYHTSNERFEWGSNAFFMNEAMLQLVAYRITNDKKYFEVALGNLDYILGKNPLNKSYVTGFGDDPPMHIHHRISISDGVTEPVPGMMVGGPNPEDVVDCGPDAYPSPLPALSYKDNVCSYSTNEVTINWNAPLSYVVGSICAITQNEFAHLLPQISIDGNKFVTPDGVQIIFKGVAMPDMFRLDETGHWNKKYFDEIKAWNCNIVRILIPPRSWRTYGKEKFFELVDRAIVLASQRNMYIVIDWHSMGNLKDELFQEESRITSMQETLDFWATVAKKYKGENTIAFYEIFNEPTDFFGKLGELPWDDWRAIAKTIVSEIRKYDTETIPVIAGLNWGYDLSYIAEKPFDIEKIAYSVHPYPQKAKEPWEDNWEKKWGFVADKYPMIALEFGYNIEGEPGAHIPAFGSEDFGRRIINYFSKKGISWTVWCFDWRWSPTLLKDDTYEPTPTQGAFFKNVLQNNITTFETPGPKVLKNEQENAN